MDALQFKRTVYDLCAQLIRFTKIDMRPHLK